MFQNVKVDIVYYKTNTDFEMEFNLCGCCRMRLLTDKSPDRKTAVHALARAVSRSRVIMMVGSLFGDDGIIKLCAGAIGAGLSAADNKTYGISGDDRIEILNGSTPLVTPEGYFGGCIIESGPQTMILLSDNKSIRKSIMNSLIHPYIKELCAMELTEDANTLSASEEATEETPAVVPPVIPETPIAPEVPDISAEESSEEPLFEETDGDSLAEDDQEIAENILTPEEPDEPDFLQDTLLEQAIEEDIDLSEPDDDAIGFIFDSDDEPETEIPLEEYDESEAEASEFFTDSDQPMPPQDDSIELSAFEDAFKDIISNEDENYEDIPEFEDEEDFADFAQFRNFQRERALNLPISIIAILLLILTAVVCYCIFYVPAKDGISAAEYLRQIFTTLFG